MPPRLDPDTTTERLQVVAPRSLVERVDEWRRRQLHIPNRSAALRMLVERALDEEDANRVFRDDGEPMTLGEVASGRR